MISPSLQSINYSFTDDGVHYIQVLQSNEAAVDILFETIIKHAFEADKNSTVRFCIDTTRSGVLPHGYILEQVRSKVLNLLKNRSALPYVRVASIRRKHVTNSLTAITVKAINQKRLKLEMFSPDQLDAAFDWLKQS